VFGMGTGGSLSLQSPKTRKILATHAHVRICVHLCSSVSHFLKTCFVPLAQAYVVRATSKSRPVRTQLFDLNIDGLPLFS
jgi:hypothetical protein